jgi:very-short-patch-repair endonuclease
MSGKSRRTRQAQSLRKKYVPAEALLWNALRNRALGGFKFRRQHPIGPYIVDFACIECMVVVEVDGTSHLAAKAAAEKRNQFMAAAGWHLLRFWNTDVFDDFEPVKESIYAECVRRAQPKHSPLTPYPSPPADQSLARFLALLAGGEGRKSASIEYYPELARVSPRKADTLL